MATTMNLHSIHTLLNLSFLGAASEMYRIDDNCFAVGVGVFSPIGTFAMLAATFFAALAIDWVRAIFFFFAFDICFFFSFV
jgi:hypothetical protein